MYFRPPFGQEHLATFNLLTLNTSQLQHTLELIWTEDPKQLVWGKVFLRAADSDPRGAMQQQVFNSVSHLQAEKPEPSELCHS